MTLNRRPASTVGEILVVLSITATLAGSLLPAVQMAREAGRRANCLANLNQIAKAGIVYHTSQQYLPPSRSWAPKALATNNAFPAALHAQNAATYTWVQPLLAQLDRQDIAS